LPSKHRLIALQYQNEGLAMHTNRFVVFQVEDEWLVTYGDRRQIAFATRQEAEKSAFDAADALARSGHAVSVLIMPNGSEADAPHFAVLTGHRSQIRLN
jgi:hypothetical protein